jgi:hypothetical protein
MSKINSDMGDLKKKRLFILSCIFYVPAVILEETICRHIWLGVNIVPKKFYEDILYDIETMSKNIPKMKGV